jgi:hypothetical protein
MSSSKKFTFLDNTNIRESIATHGNGKIIGQIYKDSKIELETPPVEGLLHEEEVLGQWQQSNKWYRDANGWYYWEKAVRPASRLNLGYEWISFDKNFIGRVATRQEKIKELEMAKHTGGKGVKVAVLDLYFTTNHLIMKKLNKNNFINCNDQSDIINNDVYSKHETHGTFCTSVLTARPFQGFPFAGVAPAIDFFFLSFGDNANQTKGLIKAIRTALNLNVDIISISRSYLPGQIESSALNDITSLFEDYRNKKIIPFISGDKDLEKEKNQLVLSSNVLGIDVHKEYSEIESETHDGIDFSFISINRTIPMFDKKVVNVGLDSSYATSIMAGLYANLLSFERTKKKNNLFRFSISEAKTVLDSYSMSIEDEAVVKGNRFYFFTVKS